MNPSHFNPMTTLRTSALALVFALAACSSDTPADTAAPASAAASTETAAPAPTAENTTAASAAEDEAIFDMPAMALLQGLVAAPGFRPPASDTGDGETVNIVFPMIWVFSPDGNINRVVSESDNLAAFAADFKAAETKGSQITCQQLESAAQAAVGTDVEVNIGCASGKWVGVTLSSNDERCTQCQAFVDTLRQTAKQHAEELQISLLFVEM